LKLSFPHFIWRMTCVLILPLVYQCEWEEPACARVWSLSIFCIYFPNFSIVYFCNILSTFLNNLNLFIFDSSPPIRHFQCLSCRFTIPVLFGSKVLLYPFHRIYMPIPVALFTICLRSSPESIPSPPQFIRNCLWAFLT
jgi:GT2 family glycosyltransferase